MNLGLPTKPFRLNLNNDCKGSLFHRVGQIGKPSILSLRDLECSAIVSYLRVEKFVSQLTS